jgi:hypothetical protein
MMLALVVGPMAAGAEGGEEPTEATPAAHASDKTGTNPLNLQRTIQVVNELDGITADAQVNYTRFRYTEPAAGGIASLKVEVPLVYAHAAFAGSAATGGGDGGAPLGAPAGPIEGSRFGLGDIGVTLSYVPYSGRTGGVLVSLQVTAPTGTSRVLGTGKWVVAPTLIYGLYLPGHAIFAPAYKQSNSFAGHADRADVNMGTLDFYLVKLFDRGRQWVTLDPTYLLNYEKARYGGATVRAIYGRVLGKVETAVFSGYLKPGVGIGPDRPNDWSAEVGVSLVGFP